MLDKDLAALYGIKNKVLKQAVRRNIDRFPFDFMFELSKKEYQCLRSQNVTLKNDKQFKIVFEAIKHLLGESEKPERKIGYVKEPHDP